MNPQANNITSPLIIEPKLIDLGGFSVRRILPIAACRKVGPWVFFDHMGPADFPAGEGINVRPHPHINLATVTYLFEGEIFHRDSLGSAVAIRPKDVNLMVAGKGIVHSERTPEPLKASGQRMSGLQLWLALPEQDEECDPAFYHYDQSDIPEVNIEGVAVRVMIGKAFGVTSPVKYFARTLYLEASLEAGQSLEIPKEEERALYVVQGEVSVGNVSVSEHHMLILNETDHPIILANQKAVIVVIGGERLSERFMEWNFVSSRKERIEQAKSDWKNGKFAIIEEDADEFIPLPE